MLKLHDEDRQALSRLLTPSWLSAMLAVTAGLLVTVGVIVAFSFHNSSIQQQLTAWQQNKPQRTLTTPDQELVQNDKPTLKGSWPLLVLWTFIGLGVYGIAAGIVRSVSRAAELRESLEYVHAKPHALLKDAAEHIVLRLLATTMLCLLLVLFFRQIVPYGITASRAAAGDLLSLSGLLYAFLSFAIVVVSVHLQVIFLRLAFGRERLFS